MSGSGSGRLESLSRKSSGTPSKPKGGLKFKPKVVARRSEQERASDAPIFKEEPKSRFDKRRGNNRGGRGGKRGGFQGGRNNFIKTETVSSGPLSNTQFTESGNSVSRTYSNSPTPAYFSNLKQQSRAGTEGVDSDDEDPGKIDLNKDLNVTEDDAVTSLFPLRPLQFANLTEDPKSKDDKEDKKIEVASRSESPELIINGKEKSVSDTPSLHLPLDFNEDDSDMEILQENLQILKLLEAYKKNEDLESFEEAKINPDLQGFKRANEEFMLLQLPTHLPEFKDPNTMEVDKNSEKKTDSNVNTHPVTKINLIEPEKPAIEGKIGALRVHKSGRITMKLGDITMDVVRSPTVGFLQDVVVRELPKSAVEPSKSTENEDEDLLDEGNIYQIGQAGYKLVTFPRLDE